MSILSFIWFFISLLVLTSANRVEQSAKWNPSGNSIMNSMSGNGWMSVSELKSLPPLDWLTTDRLENMTIHEGADYIQKYYHLSQTKWTFKPKYTAPTNNISAFYINSENKKVPFMLNEWPKIAKNDKNISDQEITIFVTGVPELGEEVEKATNKLTQSYMERYNGKPFKSNKFQFDNEESEKRDQSSSEEDYENENMRNKPPGTFIVIKLGNAVDDMMRYITFDVEKSGKEMGDLLMEFTAAANVSYDVVHMIGSNMGAHVAGAVGRYITRKTGFQLRRITGLDPAEIYARGDKALRGLARADAEFVDAIHTSAYGMGTPIRSGNADFWPNGPSEGVPGAHNVVEASMRAVRFFAETVIPGNEHNFPAVTASSMQQYKSQRGHRRRVYMGIALCPTAEGDYFLQVNSKSPFGRRAPAQRQHNYHTVHMPWTV